MRGTITLLWKKTIKELCRSRHVCDCETSYENQMGQQKLYHATLGMPINFMS